MGKKNKQRRGKIAVVLQSINLVPLFFFTVGIILLSYNLFTGAMYKEVRNTLENNATMIEALLDSTYPGNYSLVSKDTSLGQALYLYKGNQDITLEYALFDEIKSKTHLDITLFFQDTRILTTIKDKNDARIIASAAPTMVVDQVLHGGSAKFYEKTNINKVQYFSYYTPLRNSDGSIVGMLFVGKPSQEVRESILVSIAPLLSCSILVALVIAACLFIYTKKFSTVVNKLREFLADVSSGNLTAHLDESVTQRNDELGDIGRSTLEMQTALRNMIEQDPLTELFNRRSANRKLIHIISKSEQQNSPFAICIGDIDFFKKVNDTYGHDAGDLVLKKVAAALREHMHSLGFVARWGGEEFLLVFDHSNGEEARKSLEALLEKIRAMEIAYQDQIIRITMTFGVTNGDTNDYEVLIKAADNHLYYGKTNGRNRVVLEEPTE